MGCWEEQSEVLQEDGKGPAACEQFAGHYLSGHALSPASMLCPVISLNSNTHSFAGDVLSVPCACLGFECSTGVQTMGQRHQLGRRERGCNVSACG